MKTIYASLFTLNIIAMSVSIEHFNFKQLTMHIINTIKIQVFC